MYLNSPIQPVSDGPCVLKSQDQLNQSQPKDLCMDRANTDATLRSCLERRAPLPTRTFLPVPSILEKPTLETGSQAAVGANPTFCSKMCDQVAGLVQDQDCSEFRSLQPRVQ